jgi:hypothetical protein
LFSTLPTYAALVLDRPVCLFNEHYVIKPPRSHISFRWHRDSDHQLAMCHTLESTRPYVSAWCALDDMHPHNGALRMLPLNVDANKRDEESILMQVPAGSMVLFSSNVWHCSGTNQSPKYRRALYVQYSTEVIRPANVSPSGGVGGCGCSTAPNMLSPQPPFTAARWLHRRTRPAEPGNLVLNNPIYFEWQIDLCIQNWGHCKVKRSLTWHKQLCRPSGDAPATVHIQLTALLIKKCQCAVCCINRGLFLCLL